MDDLLAMTLDDARKAIQKPVVILTSRNVFSPFFGHRGVCEFLELLRDTDPNEDESETKQKEGKQCEQNATSVVYSGQFHRPTRPSTEYTTK